MEDNSWELSQPVSDKVAADVEKALEYFLSQIPTSQEAPSNTPEERAKSLTTKAAWKAGLVSGSLAVPPGPLGLLTVLPDVVAIWRIQAQLAADIASCFGKTASLTRDEMLYCLFRHTASQVARRLVVDSGSKLFVRRAALRIGDEVLCKVGVRCAQRFASRAMVRALPLLGAGIVGGYAYYDTHKVGKTCFEVFSMTDPPDICLYDVETS